MSREKYDISHIVIHRRHVWVCTQGGDPERVADIKYWNIVRRIDDALEDPSKGCFIQGCCLF